MRLLKTLGTLACAALLSVSFSPQARSDDYNQRTELTFHEPVEIPGMVLPPGTYQFRLFDSLSDRHIVQVFDQGGQHLYATVLAIPVLRQEVTDETVVTFEERPYGSPEALKTWFYPGREYGHEFIYPEDSRVSLTQAATSLEPTSGPGPSAPEPTDLTEEQAPPTAPTQAPAEPAAKPAEQAQEPAKAESELPQTATNLPLVGLLGLASLAGGIALRFAARRIG